MGTDGSAASDSAPAARRRSIGQSSSLWARMDQRRRPRLRQCDKQPLRPCGGTAALHVLRWRRRNRWSIGWRAGWLTWRGWRWGDRSTLACSLPRVGRGLRPSSPSRSNGVSSLAGMHEHGPADRLPPDQLLRASFMWASRAIVRARMHGRQRPAKRLLYKPARYRGGLPRERTQDRRERR